MTLYPFLGSSCRFAQIVTPNWEFQKTKITFLFLNSFRFELCHTVYRQIFQGFCVLVLKNSTRLAYFFYLGSSAALLD